jgi:hypothetical protein
MNRTAIELKPAGLADAAVIFNAWGRYPENFAYLLARVFSDVTDAQRYLSFTSPFGAKGTRPPRLERW